ncbi:MAG: S9 family peptidase [Rikenellaceae bacterium]
MKKLLFAVTLLLSTTAMAQHKEITLEEVVEKSPIETIYLPALQWLKDGNGYSKVEFNKEVGGSEIARYEAKDNSRTVIVPAEKLIDPITKKNIEIKSFQWSDDNSKILIFNNTKRVWRYETRGDYWVLDLKTGLLRQIGKEKPSSSLMFAKFSPDGTKVGYVSKNNIYVEDIATGIVTPITTDGGDEIINGTFDWVYEEEFNCRDGFRWSPNSKYIAYWRSNTSGTGTFYMINNIDSLYSKPMAFPYPKAGTTNSEVKVGWASANGGLTTWINLPGDARENYVPRMEFIPESNELFIQQMNREQNTNRVWVNDIETGKLENIFTDTDKAWLDTNDNVQWSLDKKYFTWESDRDNWKHVYFISRSGKDIKRITNGNFDIMQQAGIDMKNGYLYYLTTMDNFTERYLYRSKLNGKGGAELVSDPLQKGNHFYSISPNGHWALHTFSSDTIPPIYEMVSLPKGNVVRTIEDNKAAKASYKTMCLSPKEFVRVDIGEVVLDAWIVKPRNFDPSLKYPVIVEVYGEPGTAMVQNRWNGGNLWQQKMADNGYIVVSIDNRGVGLPRGREWRKCIYGSVGILAAQDQADAVRKMLSTYDYMDSDRVGVTGWSGGGSMTLHAMFRFPELYKTGIAIAAVSDQRLYDTIYQERYMGTPQKNDEGYNKAAPITYAAGLKGNLLIVHGTADDNVHYQSFEKVVNRLVSLKKPFSTMVYPMCSHMLYERENTTYHLRMTQENYWKQNLTPGGVKK